MTTASATPGANRTPVADGAGKLDSGWLPAIAGATLDTDGTLVANSDTRVATQKAVKTYADQLIAAADAQVYKGATNCSANPNYPAAEAGWTYRVSVAGKIGGASGTVVEVGDMFICLTDGTSSGTQAGVGSNWTVIQTNIDGAVVGPASITDNNFAQFDGVTGKLIKGGKAPSGTGDVACVNGPTFIGPNLGTPASGIGTNLSGTANSLTSGITKALKSVTTTVDVSAATAPAAGQALIATSATAATWQTISGAVGTIPGGRLTLTTGLPITSADVTGATSIYYTPYLNNAIRLWDGAAWTEITYTQYTLALGTLTSGQGYDIFAYNNSGALALEMLAWIDANNRATAITIQDGRICKSGDKTRLWIGSFCTTSTTTTEDSNLKRFLFNAYNREDRFLFIFDQGAYTTSAVYFTFVELTSSRAYWFNGLAGVLMEGTFSSLNDNGYSITGWMLNSASVDNGFRRSSNVGSGHLGASWGIGCSSPLGLNYVAVSAWDGGNDTIWYENLINAKVSA